MSSKIVLASVGAVIPVIIGALLAMGQLGIPLLADSGNDDDKALVQQVTDAESVADPEAIPQIDAEPVDAVEAEADRELRAQADPSYVGDALEDLDLTPQELTTSVVAESLGLDPTDEVVANAITDIGGALVAPTSPSSVGALTPTEATALLSNALVRRATALGVDPSSSEADLVAAVVDRVSMAGDALQPAELRQRVLDFLNDNRVNIMRLLPEARGAAIGLFSDSAYENAVATLEIAALTGEIIPVPMPALDGIEGVSIGDLTWDTNDAHQTITFFGSATIFGTSSDFSVALQWRNPAGPPATLVSWHTASWSLQDVGVTGELGNFRIPQTTFVVTDEPWSFDGVTPQAVRDFVGAHHGDALSGFEAATGVSLISALSTSALPDAVEKYVAGSDTTVGSRLPLSGSLGSTVAALTGSGDGSPLRLSAPIPQLGAAMPSWLSIPNGDPWELSFAKDGGAVEVALGGRAETSLGGATQRFEMSIDVLNAEGSTAVGLEGALVDPWQNPYGLTWLTLDNAVLALGTNGQDGEATLTSTGSLFGSSVDINLAVASEDGDTSASLQASIDRVSIDQAVELLGANTFLPELPAIDLSNVVFSVETAQESSASITASVSVAGKNVDLHAGLVQRPGGGYGTIFGVSMDAVRLTELVPAASGTTLDQLEFPGATLVLSNIDGKVERSTMSPSMQTFLDSSGAQLEQLNLQSGLSMISSIDFDKVGLAAPMDALGLGDEVLPLIGTLPVDAFGSGGSRGAGGLAGLDLRVDLPEFAPAGGPDWFESGQLSFFVSGAPSLGIDGRLTVNVDDTKLDFTVTAQIARDGGGYSMSLTGGLAAEEPWVAPFGLEWLTFNEARLTMGVTPIGSVNLGFGGRATIAGKDLEGAVLLEINATGAPTNFVLDASSQAGLSTNDLITVVGQMGGSRPNTSAYPSLAIRDVDLLFAPKGSAALGVEQGFALAGDAFLTIAGEERRLAAVDISLTEEGLRAFGQLGDGQPWELGPVVFRQVMIDLELALTNQRFALSGSVELFGIPFDANIDLSTRSIFLAGQQALNEIQGLVDDFDAMLQDPTDAIIVIPQLFDRAGVPRPLWLDPIIEAKAKLDEFGIERPDALDLALNGTTLSLSALPAGGVVPDNCPIISPIKSGERCWTTPPIPSTGGVPNGGAGQRCPVWAALSQGGRCYTLLPDPCDKAFEVVCDADGTPNGGTKRICGTETPFAVGGRCYTIAPTPPVGGLPSGGVDQVCGPLAPFEEGGRCYTVTPTAAGVGLRIPGVCTTFNIECDTTGFLRNQVGGSLGEGLIERFSDWDS